MFAPSGARSPFRTSFVPRGGVAAWRWLIAGVVLLSAGALRAEASARRPLELERLSYAAFMREPRLRAAMDWEDFDAALLAAAIFHETNRVRGEHGRRRLRFYRGLAAAAELQASMNALTGTTTHYNPLAGRRDVEQRVRRAGITPRRAAENVAMTQVRMRPKSGIQRLGTGDDDERGAELPWPTYEELAARLVQQWMDSPGHRANLLAREHTHLACGVSMARGGKGVEQVYAVQVFIEPSER